MWEKWYWSENASKCESTVCAGCYDLDQGTQKSSKLSEKWGFLLMELEAN